MSVYHSFSTEAGSNIKEEINFVYARPWEIHGEFPGQDQFLTMAERAKVNVKSVKKIQHHFECFDFDLSKVLPKELHIQPGDWIRLVLKENPTTGYLWRTNASKDGSGNLVEMFNNYQLPNTSMLGASGTRVLVF